MNLIGDNPNNLTLLFFAAALGGSLFFFLRVLLVLVAGVGGEDLGDLGGDEGVDGMETEGNLKMLSFNTIAVFLMMFGWMGLTAYLQFGWGAWLSSIISVAVGLVSMFVTAWVFSQFRKLESEGASFDIQQTVGQTAEVYQKIPKSGAGKIQITVDGILREVMAESLEGQAIDSFQMVEITGVRNQGLVLVKTIEK